MQWAFTYVCHCCRYICSFCLAAGAGASDGIRGSAPHTSICAPLRVVSWSLQKHRQVWSILMCWEVEGCYFERSHVFSCIPEMHPAAQWCHIFSRCRCCLTWLGDCRSKYSASLQLIRCIYVHVVGVQFSIKYIVHPRMRPDVPQGTKWIGPHPSMLIAFWK